MGNVEILQKIGYNNIKYEKGGLFMNCRRCGHELNEGDKFCPNCGYPTDVIDVDSEGVVNVKRKATFKEGIQALFSKTFTFSGVSSRSEFNFGALFLYLVGIVISWISIFPVINEMPDTLNVMEMTDYIVDQMSTTDLSSPINVAAFATTLLYVIFLAAPVFRRANDIFGNKSTSITFPVVFVLGEVLGSNYVSTLLGDFYNVISPLCLILSFGSLFVLFICIFRRGKN